MTETKAHKLTLEIMKIILVESNGFSEEEVAERDLADNEGHPTFDRIKELLINTK